MDIVRLKSFICGEWIEGSGSPVYLYNPTTEEVLAQTTTEGIEFNACLEYARNKGNPSLRNMTFAQRGELIDKISKALHEKREELIELSTKNGGNTRGDAKFDIDGATGTLAYYASLAKKLGDRKFLTDGEQQQLSRNPRFVGQHIQVPFAGAAIHINAFNFPAWGFGEKAAVALLAGMPVVTKPATSTALLAYRIAQIIIDNKILPEGAFQFIAGSCGNILDYLTCQDVLSFTGSGKTAQTLKTNRSVIASSVRYNVEADSLNAAILGPDVDRNSKTYDLFLIEVAREMTQKAGQKCTAVRRIFIPESNVGQVKEDLINEIKRVKVGNPGLKEVRMGPLASKQQLEDVKSGIERLKECAEAILGDGRRGNLLDVQDKKGFFVSPVLFYAPDPTARQIHDEEVFGPVQTLMPYSGKAEEVISYANLGAGALISSIYTDNQGFAEQMVTGIAPYNGRLHVASEKISEHSLGSGAVLPQMTHGGPGRAGGGEELGGLRGLSFYMQRTALQGSKILLERLTQ